MLAQQDDTFRLEYLVVDGGSTDNSLDIIQRYANHLAWWVSEADNGQAEAINKGFRHAIGEFIAWLNSDDLYLPGAISNAIKALQSNSALGMVYGDAFTIDACGTPINRLAFGDWDLPELARFRIICQPAVFMRKSVLDKAGYLDTGYQFMLDHHLWLRIASHAPIQHIRELWAAARQHAGAKNVAQAAGFSRETMQLLHWMQTQPEFSALFKQNTRKIIGGATRLSARYYLDGEQPWRLSKPIVGLFIIIRRTPCSIGIGLFMRFCVCWAGRTCLVGITATERRWIYPNLRFGELARIMFGTEMNKHPILVTGAHRSGTTWVGKILCASGEAAYISEPLNMWHRLGVMRKPVSGWYTYITQENEAGYLSAFQGRCGIGITWALKSNR